MQLEEWIEQSGFKKSFVAQKFQISVRYLYALCKKTKKPSKHVALHIEKATNGMVTLKDLIINEQQEKRNKND